MTLKEPCASDQHAWRVGAFYDNHLPDLVAQRVLEVFTGVLEFSSNLLTLVFLLGLVIQTRVYS